MRFRVVCALAGLALVACSDSSNAADGGLSSALPDGSIAGGDEPDAAGAGEDPGAIGSDDPGGGAGGDDPGGGASGSGGGDPGGDDGPGPIDTDGDPSWPPPPSEDLAKVPAALARGVCKALEDCLGKTALEIVFDAADCVTRTTRELEDGEFVYWQASIDAKRIAFDPDQLATCEADIGALGCDLQSSRRPPSCEALLEGRVARDGACVLDEDCEGAAYCDRSEGCPGACEALVGDGKPCVDDGQCADGLECFGGACGQSAGEGDSCEGPDGPPCHLGYLCAGPTVQDGEPGTCKAQADVFSGGEGDDCDPVAGELCEEGLSCTIELVGLSVSTTCQPRVESGAACQASIAPRQCPAGEYCPISIDPMNPSLEGTCAERPGDGEPCGGELGVCAAEHYCDGSGTCRAFSRLGERCEDDGACYSGRCQGGYCAAPERCRLDEGCGDDTCDADETCTGCPADCGACKPECGDDACNGEETCKSCEQDCGACGTCGDDACSGEETCESCEQDCGACDGCGNDRCEPDMDESCESCLADCGACPAPYSGPCDADTDCAPGSACVQVTIPNPVLFLDDFEYGYCAEACMDAGDCSGNVDQRACSDDGACRLQCNPVTGVIDPDRRCPEAMDCVLGTCTWLRPAPEPVPGP